MKIDLNDNASEVTFFICGTIIICTFLIAMCTGTDIPSLRIQEGLDPEIQEAAIDAWLEAVKETSKK